MRIVCSYRDLVSPQVVAYPGAILRHCVSHFATLHHLHHEMWRGAGEWRADGGLASLLHHEMWCGAEYFISKISKNHANCTLSAWMGVSL